MKISLGPILFYWQKQQVLDFYDEVKASDVDIIYLGETVCAKRQELRANDWLDLADMLADSGKEIVLSSLALNESNADMRALEKLCANGRFTVEANDMGAVNVLSKAELPFYCGPSVNIYNGQTLELMQLMGMTRWSLPVELGRESLQAILDYASQKDFLDKIETEVFSHGKLPLAYSARCFTARAHNLPKDDCQFNCLKYPNGLDLTSQEDQQLFTVNGIQTMSAYSYNLIDELDKMEKLGVDIVRVSPQPEGTIEIIQQFKRGESNSDLIGSDQCNGYWYGEPGKAFVPETAEAV